MTRLAKVREWACEARDPSIFEALRTTQWWSIFIVTLGPILAACAFMAAGHIPPSALSGEGRVMLAIFVLAACYWITGAIPPFATGILVMGLSVYLIGLPAQAGGLMGDHYPQSLVKGWEEFVKPAAAPIIVLMLGGFVLSQAAHKHGIDRVMAVTFIKPFGTRPAFVLLGLMVITANFSMWMSNTATAALMLALITPLVAQLPAGSPMRRALLLAVPISANIGGIGTPIGTPPNAIAFGALRALGVDITFIHWMFFGIPIVIILLLVAWVSLLFFLPPGIKRLDLKWEPAEKHPGVEQWVVYATFVLTVGLWMTSSWTGIPIAPVALIPVVIFTATRLIDRYDINSLDWDILLLMAGGLALGGGMKSTGLADWMAGVIPLGTLGHIPVLVVLCAATLAMSTFMSNTAVANLIMPIALGLAAAGTLGSGVDGTEGGLTLLPAGIAVAFGASLAMCLPVSTPPNAIAFSSGQVKVRDFVRFGLIIGVVGVVLVTIVCGVFL